MTTVVVTGGAGFIGRHVSVQLAAVGMTVVPVSRREIDGVHQVYRYTDSPEGDVLIHLAEERQRHVVNRSGESALRASAAVLRHLIDRFDGQVIYASSGVVYGDARESSCTVLMPTAGTDLYSRSKLLNEELVLRSGGSVARLSNLFGEGMAPNNVLSEIIRQIPGREALRVRDDTPVRDFLPVSDAATALARLAETRHAGVVNVGSGVGLSIRGLAEVLLSAAGEGHRKIVATHSSSRRSINVLDVSETRRILGWSPTTLLFDELARLIRR